ncbi:glycosyltransferase [Cylindrospermum stagnale PCC 7417]|uniref:Glycosyltransferase n=1 Tax=Cylindrospermum stagnale PCC 7417 TaxID=56107 RepID=K9X771_9NOST|nr:glycosyltransferase [Cylindrospermum stagnale]AFZ27926.1 glycosyltransferase [Cylindrospermum stagnale PCC 7417]
MKVIQVPFCFYPDPVGGTEVYVEALSRYLQQQGVEVLVAAPGFVSESYLHHQLRVHRFAVSPRVQNIREIYGEGDRLAASEFSRILEVEKPDLVHLHAFTSSVSLRLVQAAKQRQIPVVFTYHTPTVSCQRGTLMQWGTEICDGKVDLQKCSQCTLQGLGLNQTIAKAIGSFPPQIGYLLGSLNLQGGVWTALRMTELVNLRHANLNSLLSEVNHIVAVCNWIKDVLLLNDVPLSKITVIPQGLCHDLTKKANYSPQCYTPTLKIAFLGRLNPTKGIHILIAALRAVPDLPISLDIYGVSQGIASDTYQQELQALAANDPRIRFKPPVPAEQVTVTLVDYDLLAVPSQWLETGPMVVLEAFAARVPVIGSNLGGIAELVQSEVNGILVEPSSVTAWSQALQRLCQDRDLLMRLGSGIQPPQRMETVATQMLSIYRAALQNQTTST